MAAWKPESGTTPVWVSGLEETRGNTGDVLKTAGAAVHAGATRRHRWPGVLWAGLGAATPQEGKELGGPF